MNNRSALALALLLSACGPSPTVNLGGGLLDAGPDPDATAGPDSGPSADAGLLTGRDATVDAGRTDGTFLPPDLGPGDTGHDSDGGEFADGSVFGPDLEVRWVEASNPILPGATASFRVVARNLGATAAANRVSIRLCAGSCASAPAIELVRIATPDLAPGAVITLDATANIPSSLTVGIFRLEAMVDPDQSLAETSETNNVDHTSATVGTPALQFGPTTQNFGDTPIGGSATAPFALFNAANDTITGSYYLSPDSDPAFTLGSGSPTPFSLAPNGTFALSVSFTPSHFGPHRGAILVIIDPNTAPSIVIPLLGEGL